MIFRGQKGKTWKLLLWQPRGFCSTPIKYWGYESLSQHKIEERNVNTTKIQNSDFYNLLWIPDILKRFVEEFFGGRSLVTNFGLTLLSCEHGKAAQQGKNLVVLWENLKTRRKHFLIKPLWKEISGCTKSCRYQKCFWTAVAAVCKCSGKFYSLSAFARAFNCSSLKNLFCKLQSTSSFYIQLQQQTLGRSFK